MFDFLFGRKKKKTSQKEEELNKEADPSPLPTSTIQLKVGGEHQQNPNVPNPKKSKGVFTSYKLEYLYELIGEAKIQNKLVELNGRATMGVSFKDFITNESRFNKGEMWVLGVIVDSYFPDDAEVVKLVYEASKKYSDQWCSRHFLYASIIKAFYKHRRKEQQLALMIEGEYIIDKKRLTNDSITLELRKRRAPGMGHYLFHRSTSERTDIWHLEPAGEDNCWTFQKVNEVFRLEVINDSAVITKTETNPVTASSISVDEMDSIVDEMINFYTSHFAEISNAMRDDMETKVANAFVWEIMDYYEGHTTKWKDLVTMNNRYRSVWTKIETY